MNLKNGIKIIFSEEKSDYELLDTGEGQRLERFGDFSFIRPYEEAIWKKTLKKEWNEANGEFVSSKKGEKAGWKMKNNTAKNWVMSYRDIKFNVAPTPFRHFGFFPEQASHWDFIENEIKNSGRHIKFLNLFGYTGVASLFALRAGALVTHVDASKQSLELAQKNQSTSNLEDLPMRIICDDVLKFIEREIKRGNKYDAIIMDPPKFGRGPKGETWKIEEMLPKLLQGVKKILSDKPLFVILTSYATDSSALSLGYSLENIMAKGEVSVGELCVIEKSNSRAISLAHTAIWKDK